MREKDKKNEDICIETERKKLNWEIVKESDKENESKNEILI